MTDKHKQFADELESTKKWLCKYILSGGITPLDHAILIKFDSWLTGKEYDIKHRVLCLECLGRLSRTNTGVDGVLQSAMMCNDCKKIVADGKT